MIAWSHTITTKWMQGIIKKRTWSTSLEFHQAFHRVRNGKARFRHDMSWFFSNLTIVATRRYILPLLTQRSRTHYFIIAHNQFLFDISKGKTKKGWLRRIILPNTVADFLNISKANTWREMFENPAIFKPEKTTTSIFTSGYLLLCPTFSIFSKSLHPEC